jgi:Fic family protein
MRETGIYQNIGEMRYFIPHPLPPSNPHLQMNNEIMALYGEASFSLGQLNETSKRLPNLNRFIKAYVIKEALLSSAIEGIQTTLIDVFTQPINNIKINKDTQLVINYTHSLETALNMVKEEGFPIVSRVILAAHNSLMAYGEGEKASPGQYRQQSVRVGNLIPPPATDVPRLMGLLEKYINEPSDIPPLIKAGLAHVHFETIHPFLDGNGRIGRLLIVLMLISYNLIEAPILYPSYYFKKYHLEYYQYLDRVRTHGDYENWVAFYLKAIKDSALDAYLRAKEIEELEKKLKDIVYNNQKFAKMRDTALSTVNILFSHPVISITELSAGIGKAYNTAHHILKQFIDLGILSENNAQRRNKTYRFEPYLALLEKE